MEQFDKIDACNPKEISQEALEKGTAVFYKTVNEPAIVACKY